MYSLILRAYILDIRYANLLNTPRSAHETIIKNFGQNVVAVSTSFRDFSDRVGASLTTPKTEEKNTHTPLAVPLPPSSKLPDASTIVMDGTFYFTQDPPRPPKQEDFPDVLNWFPSSYNSKRKAGKKGEAFEAEENGRKPKGSILSSYMVDRQGRVVPKPMQDTVRNTARGFYQLLLAIKRAPTNWGNAAIDIKNELRYRLETEHEFMRYCHNHWKADMIATNSYPQWVGGRLDPTSDKNTPAEVIDVELDNNDEAQKRPRDKEEGVSGPSKRPRVKEVPSSTSTRHRPKPTPVNKKPQAVCKFLPTGCMYH